MGDLCQSVASKRDGFKRVGEHRDGCLALRKGEPFVVTDRDKPREYGLTKNGRAGGSTMWWRFVCNDIECQTVLLVRWDQIMHFINGALMAEWEAERAERALYG